jgi:hypothetical protein
MTRPDTEPSRTRPCGPGAPGLPSLLLAALLLGPPGCGDDAAPGDTGPDDATVEDDVGADADADGDAGPDTGDTDDAAPEDAPPEDLVEAVDETPPPPVVVTPALDLLPSADPKLEGFDGWPLLFDVDPAGRVGLRCRVTLTRPAGTIVALDGTLDAARCTATWDGRDAAGAWLAPGAVTATAEILAATGDEVLASAAAELEIVRLGIDGVQLLPGPVGKRVDLLWAAMDGEEDGWWLFPRDAAPWGLDRDAAEPAGAVDLELDDGTPRPLPAPWDDLRSPPLDAASADGSEQDTFNLPTAWSAGSLVEATATLSSDVAGAPGGGAPTATEVRVLAPAGTRLVGEGPFAPGGTVTARTEASPIPAVQRTELTLVWRFESRRPDGPWVPVPGAVTTVHRLYGVVNQATFADPGVPHLAWVDVVDTVAGWVDGASADPATVAGRIVEGVYGTLGLRYDNVRGASAYSDYPDGWDDGVFFAGAFQRRDWGSTINCSDAAGIVGAYANMVGIDMRYHILTHAWNDGFDLNYIQPIGFDAFDETPFAMGGGSFSYHAVAGPADGSIYDATLALDGDGVPTAPPHTFLLAQGLPPHDYLFDLSSDWEGVRVRFNETVELR